MNENTCSMYNITQPNMARFAGCLFGITHESLCHYIASQGEQGIFFQSVVQHTALLKMDVAHVVADLVSAGLVEAIGDTIFNSLLCVKSSVDISYLVDKQFITPLQFRQHFTHRVQRVCNTNRVRRFTRMFHVTHRQRTRRTRRIRQQL
jgi:hypothetical protein